MFILTALETAQLYFDLSNNSDFEVISKLFTDTTTYSSANTGIYLGVDNIMTMQKEFHGKFKNLHWTVNSVKELKPGIILFDYDFEAITKSDETVRRSGLEYVIVFEDKIQHIEIRNKE